MSDLSKRARSVLYAVITEFIATGEPVSSRTLAKKYGLELSPASIRNVLADLEEGGFLAQPHTSAGRVPTEAAFRLFIDALMRVRKLTPGEAAAIEESFGELRAGGDIMRVTGRLLSELTGSAAVVVRRPVETRTLVKVRFIPTRPSEMLAVIVLSDGTVENRFLDVETALTDSELERLHNMLEEAVVGRTLADLRVYFGAQVTEGRGEIDVLRRLGQSLLGAAIAKSDRRADIVIEGQARLLEQPEFASAERLRDLMHVLEVQERLVQLLDRTIESGRVQVFLGRETSEMVGYPMSVVAARYSEGGRPSGAVGILGPTRMDYPALVPLVGATADAVSAALARGAREASPALADEAEAERRGVLVALDERSSEDDA